MSKLKELLEKRAQVVADMRDITKQSEVEGLKEERKNELDAQWDKAEAREAELSKQIQRLQRMEELEKEAAEKHLEAREKSENGKTKGSDEKSEYREAFKTWFTRGRSALDAEQRALLEKRNQTTTNTEGGYTVPQDLLPELVRTMKDYSGIFQAARVLNTSDGRLLTIPTTDNTARKAVLTAEAGAVAKQNQVFGQKTLTAYKYTDLMQVSSELMADSAFDIGAEIAFSLGEGFGRAMNESCTVGTGTNQPNGVVTASTLGKTAASATAITIEEILDLVHSVDPAYRRSNSCGFMFHDQVLKVLKKLKDGENRPLWKASVREGEPDTFDGFRYWLNQDMSSAVTTGLKTILFGDFNKFVVRNVMNTTIKRADELFMQNDLVGFFGFARWDSELLDTAAVKHLIQA